MAFKFFKKKDTGVTGAAAAKGAPSAKDAPAGKTTPPVPDAKGKPAAAGAKDATALAGAPAGTPGVPPTPSGDEAPPKRDPRKAQSFFRHAATVADTRNYDYAIELYLRGLAHDPDNMDKHQGLRDVALKRKVSGGRPAGWRDTIKLKRKDLVQRMLDAEGLLAKDPLNLKRMIAVMEAAVAANDANDDVNLAEVAYWVGEMILDKGQTDKPPAKEDLIKVRDLYAKIGVWDKAVLACRLAIQMDPGNEPLLDELRDMEAELVIIEGKYNQDATQSVRNMDQQRDLANQDVLNKAPSAADEIIVKRRAELAEAPADNDKALKLIEALIGKDSEAEGEEAAKMLGVLHAGTGQYRYKERIGDVKMRNMTRKLKALKTRLDDLPDDEGLRKEYEAAVRTQLAFELEEYAERVKNYPTDMSRKFELGRRLFHAEKYQEAIDMFQQAKNDPKFRSMALERLGRCYLALDWLDEAVQTLTEGYNEHKNVGDKQWFELAWTYMSALERQGARNKDAQQIQQGVKIASQILQTNINYRDIKNRLDRLRQLHKQLIAIGPKGTDHPTPPPPTKPPA